MDFLGFKVVENAVKAKTELTNPVDIHDMRKGAEISNRAILRMQKIGKAILALADINKEPNAEKMEQLNFEQFFGAIQTKLTVDNLQALFFVALYNHYEGNPAADSLDYQMIREITEKQLWLDLNKLHEENTEDFLKKVFEDADMDGDEQINFEEFVRFLQLVTGEHPKNPLIVRGQGEYSFFKLMEGDAAGMEDTLAELEDKQKEWENQFQEREKAFINKRKKKKKALEKRLDGLKKLVGKLKERDGILSDATQNFIIDYQKTIDDDKKAMNDMIDAYNAVRTNRKIYRNEIQTLRTNFFQVFHGEFMNKERYQELLDLVTSIQTMAESMEAMVKDSKPLVLNRNQHWERMAAAEVIPAIGLYDYDACNSEVDRGRKRLEVYNDTVGSANKNSTESVENIVGKLKQFKRQQFDNVHLRMRKRQLDASISKATADQKKVDLKSVLMDFELHALNGDSLAMKDLKDDKDRAVLDKEQAQREFVEASDLFLKTDRELRQKLIRLQKLQIELAGLRLMLPNIDQNYQPNHKDSGFF